MPPSTPTPPAPPSGVAAYAHGSGVYVNLTNRCPTSCVFCFKRPARWNFEGQDLRLGPREPSVQEALRAAEALLEAGRFNELIFCGYGESTYRLGAMTALGAEIGRRRPAVRRRLNTIGLGSLIWGWNIAPQLKRCVDAVSVSLNTADPAQWRALHRPEAKFAVEGFDAAVRFVEDCVAAGLDATVTAVRLPGVDLAAVKGLARLLGAEFRERPLLTSEASL